MNDQMPTSTTTVVPRAPRTVSVSAWDSRDVAQLTALLAVAFLGLNLPLFWGITTGTLAVAVLIPVWVGTLRKFRLAPAIMLLALAALLWGSVLNQFQGDREFNARLAVEIAALFITGLGGLGLLLWARTVLPTHQVVIIFGVGYLLKMLTEVSASNNPWKYQLSVPLAMIALALVSRAKSAVPTVVCLLVLGLISIPADSRSFFGFCLLAIVLFLWQRRPRTPGRKMGKFLTISLLAITLAALYSLGTALLVEGYLGDDAQARTVQQIQESGSLLVGGRPEWAGTVELMTHHPMGFGLGTLPAGADVWQVKAGMRAIGVDTENGYVNNYMFGGHIKLHSVIADLWASFGVVGLALGILLIVALVYSLLDHLSHRSATGLVCLLTILGIWDLAFGPIFKNLPDIMLALAVALPLVARAPATAPEPRSD